ncbi:AraC family transcriptional regulator [Hymenobacter siberiensis]|uniref:AraC family transcriptional regulator n=1 Tax=Hymenobacter siberiensis TaxID=2848396 RepID=UPI001C1DD6CD|nr:AraC family transcriptional regulator [Hymenobacter siberiensis]MBU6121734.1 AraC family transcriptional regulator [Hymenobacter siberiensis]
MLPTHLLPDIPLTHSSDLTTLIDHRRVQTLEKYELSILETLVPGDQVAQSFSDLVLTNMLRGKKVMHLLDQQAFHYLPGNTMVVPPNLKMMIDFPEASDENPTQCVALAIDRLQIIDTVNYLNEFYPKTEDSWSFSFTNYHFYNNEEITALIYKLVRIGFDNSQNKDILADFAVKELLLRLMQLQSLHAIESNVAVLATSNRFAYTLSYIRENIAEKLSIEDLSAQAYMSKPNFFRAFKQEFGLSPMDYIIKERMRVAKRCLRNPTLSITDICFKAGFNNPAYFTRMFRQLEGMTPTEYRTLALA